MIASVDPVLEATVAVSRCPDPADRSAFRNPGEHRTGNFRQQGPTQAVVYVARARVDLGTTLQDRLDKGPVPLERRFMVRCDSFAYPPQFEFDDLRQDLVANRVIGHHLQAAEEGRL